MLDVEYIKQNIHPFGFRATDIKVDDEDSDYRIYYANFAGVTSDGTDKQKLIEFALPKPIPGSDRIIPVEGLGSTRYRIICYKGYPDTLCVSSIQDFTNDLIIEDWRYSVAKAVETIISDSMADWFFNGEDLVPETIIQRIDNWLNTASHIIDVDPNNQMKIQSASEAVYMDIAEESMTHNARIFDKSWLKKLDAASTSTSNKINLVYRLCKGAEVQKNGRVKPSDQHFCSTIANNAIGLSLTPRRIYLLRTTMENSEKLVFPDTPLIARDTHNIDGVHLETAIMHYGYSTFEDAIVISESAATALSCKVYKRQTFKSIHPIHISVNVGDWVRPNEMVAECENETAFAVTKIHTDSKVEKIEFSTTTLHGHKGYVLRITFSSVYKMQNGDKLTTRAAGKGVVKILPDAMMPTKEDGTIIHACISPESVYGRRSMLTYWEMMAHSFIEDGGEVDPDLYSPKPTFKELVDKGYGDKQQLSVNNLKLPELTFCGKVYFIRINKHSREQVSAKGSRVITNQYGLPVDDAKVSGQRVDIAKAMALNAHGDRETLFTLIKNGHNPSKRFNELMKILTEK